MTVFANMLEISCKAQSNQVIAAMPDVCFTPPEAPPTPPGVPIPYPSFGLDGDDDKGTGTVKIGGKTISHKNKSYFTKTMGTEAGVAAKKGIITSKNTGKSYNQAWSGNVKAEGQPVSRFSDISTNNHGSIPGNTPPWPKIAKPGGPDSPDPCEGEKEKIKEACGDKTREECCEEAGLDTGPLTKKSGAPSSGKKQKTSAGSDAASAKESAGSDVWLSSDFATAAVAIGGASGAPAGKFRDKQRYIDEWEAAEANKCLAASRCKLEPYNGGNSCCPGQTGHHLVDAACFNETGRGDPPAAGAAKPPQLSAIKKGKSYDPDKAPVICAEGPSATKGSHGALHTEMKAKVIAKSGPVGKGKTTAVAFGSPPKTKDVRSMGYGEFRDGAIEAVAVVFPKSNCDPACLKAQLDGYHKDELGVEDDTQVRTHLTGRGEDQLDPALAYNRARETAVRKSMTG